MSLPNLSNAMLVARLRYMQTIHEPKHRRNPDYLVRHFMPISVRLRTRLLRKESLLRLRSDPFYYYLIARTLHYDQTLRDALAEGIDRFVMVGCGSDTRSHRFQNDLREKNVNVLECDQAELIHSKQILVRRYDQLDNVEYLAVDLNDSSWPSFERWIGPDKPKTFVMLEGVSPYIDTATFSSFLRMLSSRLAPGSPLAYDFKIAGVKDAMGRSQRTKIPFRVSTSNEEAEAFHRKLGLRIEQLESSVILSKRWLPDLGEMPLFDEDGLLRLRVI